MSAKHTPGPWTAEPSSLVKFSPFDVIAKCQPNGYICRTSGNCEANASLIAAAPDLLAALRNLVAAEDKFMADSGMRWSDNVTDAVNGAKAAISKAEKGTSLI